MHPHSAVQIFLHLIFYLLVKNFFYINFFPHRWARALRLASKAELPNPESDEEEEEETNNNDSAGSDNKKTREEEEEKEEEERRLNSLPEVPIRTTVRLDFD